MRQKSITWIDEEGYTRSKWVPLSREEEIATDVAESLKRQESLIFGYTWEQIKVMQKGGK